MTLESVLVEMTRKINTLQAKVNEHDRRLIRAPLHAGASKVLAIASGAVEATRPYIHLVPETGITDTLDSITNGSDGKMIIIANSRVGDTITVNPFSVGGGNIDLNGSVTPYVLDDIHDSLTFIYRGDTSHWEQIGASGSGSGGAVDSVNGQTGVVVLDTDDIAEGITNLWFTAAEETKLAGIEALADVTDAANMAAAIIAQPGKTTPVDTDIFPGLDSADTYQIKEFSWADIKTALTTLFSGLYVALLGDQNVGGIKTFTSNLIASAGAAIAGLTITPSASLSTIQTDSIDARLRMIALRSDPSFIYWNVEDPSGNIGLSIAKDRSQYNIMKGFAVEGVIYLGRSDGVQRGHRIKVFNDSVQANNYVKVAVHDGTVGSDVDVLALYGDRRVAVVPGSASDEANVGGTIYTSATQVGNIGIGEDDLASFTVLANTLLAFGQSIWFEAFGTLANNGATKTLRVRFGGQLIMDSTASPVGNTGWHIRGRIVRTGAATQKAFGMYNRLGATEVDYAALTLTLSSPNILKITGEATSNNDIVLQSFVVGWENNHS